MDGHYIRQLSTFIPIFMWNLTFRKSLPIFNVIMFRYVWMGLISIVVPIFMYDLILSKSLPPTYIHSNDLWVYRYRWMFTSLVINVATNFHV